LVSYAHKYTTFEERRMTMTDMKRTTVSFPDEIVMELEKLKKSSGYEKCTYSEIIRRLVIRGLEADERSDKI
jgi:metal-responsive CopG/Arc/MetJ family transcriptional regulator